MSEHLQKTQQRTVFRSLPNYVKQHPKAQGAYTLTEGRKMAFGVKQSLHGLHGKVLDSAGRNFWMEKGYPV